MNKLIAEDSGKILIFDVEELKYISSAGLRILLKIRKKIRQKISIQNVSDEIFEIFRVTGIDNFFDVQKKLREISTENCKQIGAGVQSKVYQLDADTIVKIYNKNFSLEKIKSEIDVAKKIFILGFPTAISYDVVKCGENFGLVFEKVGDSISVGKYVTENPEKISKIFEQMAQLLKNIHSTEVEVEESLPSLKERCYASERIYKIFCGGGAAETFFGRKKISRSSRETFK